MSKNWTVADMPSLAGRRYLITGANSGIGYAAALELSRHGAVVVLACRDAGRGRDAVERLRVEASGPPAELVLLDLASLEDVHRVADEQLARGLPLDGLINNAGVFSPPVRRETADGFELQFGTNVLAHFALTCRLLPVITDRVVTVASIAHKRGQIAFDDLQSTRKYDKMQAYAQSKLGDLLFALELDARLRARGSNVRSIAVHPGVARSNLFKVGSSTGVARSLERVISAGVGALFNSDVEGALPTLFGATAPEAEGGAYYGSQGFQEMRGGDVGLAQIAPQAQDGAARRRLWDVCAELTGVDL